MKDINLLPKEYREKIKFKRILKIQVILFLVAFVFFFGSYYISNAFLKQKNDILNQLENQTSDAKYAESEAIAEEIYYLQSDIESYSTFIQELSSLNTVDIKIYYDFAGALSSEVNLTKFYLKNGFCIVEGEARSRALAADYISEIESLPYVHEVNIVFLSLQSNDNNVNFSLEIILNQ